MPTNHGSIVYIIESLSCPGRHYTGKTSNLRRRMLEHNRDGDDWTARYRPWRVIAAIWLPDRTKALALERYLKSGSGRAFAKRHF